MNLFIAGLITGVVIIVCGVAFVAMCCHHGPDQDESDYDPSYGN